MKPEVKEKWLTALRSGEYQQARAVLKSKEGKFCCLGVLTDLYAKEHNLQWGEPLSDKDQHYQFQGNGGYLSPDVVAWSGLNGSCPSLRSDKLPPVMVNKDMPREAYLSQLNDTASLTFEQIAELIEESL